MLDAHLIADQYDREEKVAEARELLTEWIGWLPQDEPGEDGVFDVDPYSAPVVTGS